MKILVTGGTGQLGRAVIKRLHALQIECLGTGSADMDITDQQAVWNVVKEFRPDAIIHCAAWTDVDLAEKHIASCARVNGLGTLNVVRAAQRIGAKLMYISSDYIFHGEGTEPIPAKAYADPVNVYGMSKGQGELAVVSMMEHHFIVRCSWTYGTDTGFPAAIQQLAKTQSTLRVVDDQIGSPTYVADLAVLLCDMIRTERYGRYNVSAEGECSRYEFAVKVLQLAGIRGKVIPVKTQDFHTAARRPMNSRFDKSCLDAAGFARLPDWQDGLARCIRDRNHTDGDVL